MAECLPAGRRWRAAALSLLYGQLEQHERDHQLTATLEAAQRDEISLDDLLVAVESDHVIGVVLGIRRPGRMAFVWPPVISPSAAADVVSRDLLIALGKRWDAAGVVFSQCVLDPEDRTRRELMARGGWRHAADLLVLSRSVSDLGIEPDELISVPYDAAHVAELRRVLAETAIGTLDCPELARRRDAQDVLAAHGEAGHFEPRLWRMFFCAGRPAGVVLMADHAQRDVREVVYLGVVPEFRGRGLGRRIMTSALRMAAEDGIATLELAVDAANWPALRVYRELRFVDRARHVVFLRFSRE